MSDQAVYCHNCKKCSRSKANGSGWITIILLFFYIVPGIIYEIWRKSGLGRCSHCNSTQVMKESDARANNLINYTVGKNAISPSNHAIESVRQVNCPDCRELIRFDARKCKHCGSYINDQKSV